MSYDKSWSRLAGLLAGCTVALIAPGLARADCVHPNNATCEFSSPTTLYEFYNGYSAPGVVTITSGVTLQAGWYYYLNGYYAPGTTYINAGGSISNSISFYNGTFAEGILAINSGGIFSNFGIFYNGYQANGTVIVRDGGLFTNSGTFYNGYYYGYVGTVTVSDGGTFTNSGTFRNGASDYYYYYGSTGTVTVRNGGIFTNSGTFHNGGSDYYYYGSTGTVTVRDGGIFTNSGTFYNGGSDYYYYYGSVGTVTVGNGGTFTNSGTFHNGFYDAYYGYSGTGTVTIDAGGTFTNTASGTIVQASTGTFANAGTFINYGSLSGGSFTNEATGLFVQAPGNALGSGGSLTFTNHGTFDIGPRSSALPIATTTLTGSYTQSATGSLAIRTDWATGTSDKLAITGSAMLAGTIIVTPVNVPGTPSLITTFENVITATGGITDNGITAQNTAAVTYTVLKPDSNTIDLVATINFLSPGSNGLTPNQQHVGSALNSLYAGSGTTLSFIPALMQVPTNAQFANALNQLSPTGDAGSFTTAMSTGATFGQQLLSCRMAGDEADPTRFIKEDQCAWTRFGGRRLESDGRGQAGFDEMTMFYSAGVQFKVAPEWRLGGGIGYENVRLSSDANAFSTGDRFHLGGVLKYTPGPWLFAAAVTGGWGWQDNRRDVAFGGFTSTATSSTDINFVGSRLTAAYLMSQGAFYLKPQVDLAATYLSRDAYTETGAGGIALHVAASDDTVLSASPSLEIGAEQRLANGTVLRAFIKGGATFRDTDTFVTSASFVGAPIGAPGFAITSQIDKSVADLGAGIDLIATDGLAVRVQYDGQFGDTTTLHSGSTKISIKF